jgi:hypothetical protein
MAVSPSNRPRHNHDRGFHVDFPLGSREELMACGLAGYGAVLHNRCQPSPPDRGLQFLKVNCQYLLLVYNNEMGNRSKGNF